VQAAYTLMLGLGFVVGLGWLVAGAADSRPSRSAASAIGPLSRLDAGLLAIALGLIGSRLGYVAAHATYFQQHPGQIMAIWLGGLAWAGGALGAILGLAVYARTSGTPFWSLVDLMAVPACLTAAAAWLACLSAGCAYGRRSTAWLALPGPDQFGLRAERWPTQLIGAVLCLSAVWILFHVGRRPHPGGSLACLALVMIGSISAVISVLRADPVPLIAGVRAEALTSGALAAVGLVGLGLRRASPPEVL
jgi:phosphatidylglycerol---prolipoprotein diacylglyceryl transferase